MKPLELRVHEKHPTLDAYRFGPSYTPYAIVAVDKRFTEAELAAEYHALDAFEWELAMISIPGSSDGRLATLRRFATYPHYDEDTK